MRDHEKRLDEIMRRALASDERPDEELNRLILRQWKERTDMKRNMTKRIYATAVACAALLVTVSAGAAVRYLTMDEIAGEVDADGSIAAAFSDGDAIWIDEKQETGDYLVTLLGIAPGEALTEQGVDNVSNGGMYIVVAIENADGTPMADASEYGEKEMSFFVSPLVQGLRPWEYNAVYFSGSFSQFTEQGVAYRVVECDNILAFADRELYVCATDTTFYDNEAYHYDEATGVITRNEEYRGMNALFSLPVDPSLADPQAAAAYLERLEEEKHAETSDAADESVGDVKALMEEIREKMENGREDEALDEMQALEDETKTVQKADGRYEYEFMDGTWYFYEDDVKDGQSIQFAYTDYDEELARFTGLDMLILTENGDGTAEVKAYHKNLAE